MQHDPVSPGTASSGCRIARTSAPVLVVAFVTLGLAASGARADLLGSHPHRDGTVYLMSDLCRDGVPIAGQRARQTISGRERHGCWGVDRAGNPVVTWSDGSELELDGDKVRPSLRAPGLSEQVVKLPSSRSQVEANTTIARPRADAPRAIALEPPSPSAAAGRDFARPPWCPDARFPHERLVCTDEELADRDLRLASLWWPYRRTLSREAEAWHKSDYFRRLKACGADKVCIVAEQETQMRRYREGLPAGG